MAKAKKGKGADEKFCSSCGEVIKKEAELCPHCGVRQKGSYSGEKRSKTVAALLALFLGGIGAHEFYLGNTGIGILYLCFFWTGIPAILGLIEGIVFLCMSNEKFQAKYG